MRNAGKAQSRCSIAAGGVQGRCRANAGVVQGDCIVDCMETPDELQITAGARGRVLGGRQEGKMGSRSWAAYLEVTASFGLPLSKEGVLCGLGLQAGQHPLHILPSTCTQRNRPK